MKTERECPECGGSGQLKIYELEGHSVYWKCVYCNGTGRIKEDDRE